MCNMGIPCYGYLLISNQRSISSPFGSCLGRKFLQFLTCKEVAQLSICTPGSQCVYTNFTVMVITKYLIRQANPSLGSADSCTVEMKCGTHHSSKKCFENFRANFGANLLVGRSPIENTVSVWLMYIPVSIEQYLLSARLATFQLNLNAVTSQIQWT